MAFRTQKISQMTPKGSDLEATDLIEVSTIESGSYVTRSITGQELIDAIPAPSVDWGDIGGTLSDQTDLNTALSGKVPTSRTLTINGTTQDLSADRTFTISSGITIGTTLITSGTVGRVLFEGAGNVVQESANLFWDNTNGRLGIGTSSPTSRFHIVGAGSTSSTFSLRVQNSLNESAITVRDDRAVGLGRSVLSGESYGGISIGHPDPANILHSAYDAHTFNVWTGGAYATALLIKGNGAASRVLIGTTTDAGFRLDVNGTARVVGQATIQGMTVGLGAGANANSVAVGLASLASNSTGSANTAVGASALTSNVSGASNTGIGFAALSLLNSGSTNTSIGSASLRNVTTANNSTAIGNEAGRYIANGSTLVTTVTDSVFLGSSTKPLADSQSNQIVIGHNAIGAGSNTVTLGNTSITKTILRGTVNAANLPTSAAGLSAGDIWNDAGTLKIV